MSPRPRLERIARRNRVAEPVTEAASATEPQPILTHASEEDKRIVERAVEYSMTGPARLLALIDSVRYCTRAALGGAFVECGVWRGGSVLAMILTLQELGIDDRDIYLYDTFEGMTEPTAFDTSDAEGDAINEWREAQDQGRRAWGEVFGEQVFN
jgi:O-methyltransferase